MIGIYSAAAFDGWVFGEASLFSFDVAKANTGSIEKQAKSHSLWPAGVDFALWSEKRKGSYINTLARHIGEPMAVLTAPKFNIRVAVLEGTNEFDLNRGVGWIAGTSKPGQHGNVGIAGHRDGFFRFLKDIREGDEISLETLTGAIPYRVEEIEIVTPDRVSVLGARPVDSLTLVTCYPFYFLGDAPQRFIVHAARQSDGATGEGNLRSAAKVGISLEGGQQQ